MLGGWGKRKVRQARFAGLRQARAEGAKGGLLLGCKSSRH
jgi:hypothetical protein